MRRLLLILALCLLPASVAGQVVHDATSESHLAATPSTSQASFTWNHGGHATLVKGVVVFVFQLNVSTNDVTSVTYGGTAMTAVTGGAAADTAGEQGRTTAYFLGSSVPQGTQAVIVNRNNNANQMYAVAATVTAGGDTAVHEAGIVLLQENQIVSEQSVTDGSPGTNSVRYAGLFWGRTVDPTAGANSTELHNITMSSQVAWVVRETTAGQGSRSVGFSTGGSSDDTAAVHLAIKQTGGAAAAPKMGLMGVGGW
jgi:hypothetical protein